MKMFVVVFAIIAVASALSPVSFEPATQYQPFQYRRVEPAVQTYVKSGAYDASKDAKIIRYDNQAGVGADGYSFAVETSDGQVREEQAVIENAGTKDESLSIVGRFLYPGLDGEVKEVKYVADKDGFRPVGAHLPQPVQPIH